MVLIMKKTSSLKRVACKSLLVIALQRHVQATQNIDYRLDNTADATSLVDYLVNDSAIMDKLQSHGCWCTKLHPTNGDLLGGLPQDELDELCKQWFVVRRCNQKLVGGTCLNAVDDGSTSYTVEHTSISPMVFACDNTGKTGCETACCEIDLYWANQIRTKAIELHNNGASGFGSMGTIATCEVPNSGSGNSDAPGTTYEYTCGGTIPHLEITKSVVTTTTTEATTTVPPEPWIVAAPGEVCEDRYDDCSVYQDYAQTWPEYEVGFDIKVNGAGNTNWWRGILHIGVPDAPAMRGDRIHWPMFYFKPGSDYNIISCQRCHWSNWHSESRSPETCVTITTGWAAGEEHTVYARQYEDSSSDTGYTMQYWIDGTSVATVTGQPCNRNPHWSYAIRVGSHPAFSNNIPADVELRSIVHAEKKCASGEHFDGSSWDAACVSGEP